MTTTTTTSDQRRHQPGSGIVSIDYTVLALLVNEGGEWDVEDIETRLDVPKSTISRSTDRLARQGFITKFVSVSDKRRRVIRAVPGTNLPTPPNPRTARAIASRDDLASCVTNTDLAFKEQP